MELARLVRIEAEVELIVPAELEARLGQRVIADLCAWMAFGEISRMRRDLVQVGAAIPVTSSCSMSILADGEVTEDGLDRLIAYINPIKGSFPKSSLDDLYHEVNGN